MQMMENSDSGLKGCQNTQRGDERDHQAERYINVDGAIDEKCSVVKDSSQPSSSKLVNLTSTDHTTPYSNSRKFSERTRRNPRTVQNENRGAGGLVTKMVRGGTGGGRRPEVLHFLHGGNIRDPLNLKSVRPEEPNAHAKDRPVELIVPKNPNDPLNLHNMPTLEEMAKKRKKKRKNSIPLDEIIVSPLVCQRRFPKKSKRAFEDAKSVVCEDKFFPVISDTSEQITSCSSLTAHVASFVDATSTVDAKEAEVESRKLEENSNELAYRKAEKQRLINNKYCYGNYNQYRKRQSAVGFGTDPVHFDTRVQIFCEDWFEGKQVLDVGCGAGAFSISLAQSFRPSRILGVDIDSHLIGAARKNIRYFVDKNAKVTGKFPTSFAVNFGPISVPSTSTNDYFPENIFFKTENYVPANDEELKECSTDLFDIVTAISVVKWVHLNWGDAGLKRFFRRAFCEMRKGGRFIVEIESADAYRKLQRKNRLTEQMRENLERMSFYPDDFCAYLLDETDGVGFKHHETLETPLAHTLGWSGRLHVFYKGEFMITGAQN